jgi:hypothetical protein
MLYNQPYGVSDPNAPYINGNPSTGTMGSIPPAASIEYPQREIVNFITRNNFTPTNADLFQLTRAVQSGIVNYGLDVGAINAIAITPTQPIAAYALGQRFIIKMTYPNTSQVTLNVSGLGAKPLVHLDLTPLNPWELLAGEMIEVAYDGTRFQLISGGPPGTIVSLTQPRDLYVNDAIGSDTLYDGTTPTITGVMGGPFKTIQKALDQVPKFNLGGWYFTIHVADGTYFSTSLNLRTPNGSGTIFITGNPTTPANCIIHSTAGTAFMHANGGHYRANGFRLLVDGPQGGDPGHAIYSGFNGGEFDVDAMNFGNVAAGHMVAGNNGQIQFWGPITVSGSPLGGDHCFASGNGAVFSEPIPTLPTVNITAPINVQNWANASDGGVVTLKYSSITGAANVSGRKYNANINGIVETFGGGASYLPGTLAGTTNNGGQYG